MYSCMCSEWAYKLHYSPCRRFCLAKAGFDHHSNHPQCVLSCILDGVRRMQLAGRGCLPKLPV